MNVLLAAAELEPAAGGKIAGDDIVNGEDSEDRVTTYDGNMFSTRCYMQAWIALSPNSAYPNELKCDGFEEASGVALHSCASVVHLLDMTIAWFSLTFCGL